MHRQYDGFDVIESALGPPSCRTLYIYVHQFQSCCFQSGIVRFHAGQLLYDLGVTRAEQGPVTPEEGKAAREVMLVGSVINVAPVVMWDDEPTGVGDGVEAGKPGPVAMALHAALVKDFAENADERTPVPYDVFKKS